jgi:hypothetical protein
MPPKFIIVGAIDATPLHLQTHPTKRCSKNDALKMENDTNSVANVRFRRAGSRVLCSTRAMEKESYKNDAFDKENDTK